MNFYYLGQTSFGNRGCEALIRSNTKIIREAYPGSTFLCPSFHPELDSKQWPDAAEHGVRFVQAPQYPFGLKVWNRILRAAPQAHGWLAPLPFSPDAHTRELFEGVDAVLMTGGDIVSLDYELFSLHFWTGLVDAAARMGKPVHLLAASVGPFLKDPVTERRMVAHLKRYASITVRETATQSYLDGLGVSNVQLVADPAFVLDPEPWDISGIIVEGRDHVGLNVSPLVRATHKGEASRTAFDEEVKAFMRDIAARGEHDLVLVPHVDPLDGRGANSDRAYMQGLLDGLEPAVRARVRITPDLLNAAQIKYLLGKCRYFVGARTHATVGAISQSVPTTSIAYSVKALGINRDLFGSTKYVLPTPEVTGASLQAALTLLQRDEEGIKSMLAQRLPEWRQRARQGIAGLAQGRAGEKRSHAER